MTRWEYFAKLIKGTETAETLDRLGGDGWECFFIEPDNGGGTTLFWFKRPVEAQP